MPIWTGSVLDRPCNEVDKAERRVVRARERVEELREQYRTAHWSKRREVEVKGLRAREALAKAEADYKAAKLALSVEEARLAQPESFLRYG